ncbi:MAG: integration host factor subunit beta [Desulfovibrionaceae bacterium]|nr:integration host factor subunit beta [Desulfovibrionaceae bacterium]
MNKSELIKQLADRTQISQEEADIMVHTLIDEMKKTLCSGGRVEIRGFCNFSVRSYESYTGRNPKTGELMEVPAKKLPFFKPGKEFKEFLNE